MVGIMGIMGACMNKQSILIVFRCMDRNTMASIKMINGI